MEDSRLEKLEKEVADLRDKFKSSNIGDKPKKEKKHREPNVYNLYMQKELARLKADQGEKYIHKDAFKCVAESWQALKNKK
jgi:hypothetical protein